MILDISSALMSIVYSGGPCPPVALRGDPFAPLRCLLREPLLPGRASWGPLRPTPLFTPAAPVPRSRFVATPSPHSAVSSESPCSPVALRGAPSPHSAVYSGSLPPGRASWGPLR